MPNRPRQEEVDALLELTPVLVGIALAAHEAAGAAVSLPQYRALYVLNRWGPCSAGRLADRLGVHTSSVTRVCDRLARSGLLSRRLNPENRREVVLEVTEAGRRVVRQVLDVRSDEMRRILSALPASARRDLVRLVPLIVEADKRSRERDSWAG